MKSTGIIRKIDELDRIVLPKELRGSFGTKDKDPVEIYTEGSNIILRVYRPGCVFCGADHKYEHKGLRICASCLSDLKRK